MHSLARVLATLPVLIATACRTGTAGAGSAPSAQAAGTSIEGHSDDVRAIQNILAETDAAWNNHDAAGLAAHSTEDIDHSGVRGNWSRGKSELNAEFATVTPRISNTVSGSIERIRFLTPEIAVAIIRRQYKSATETRNAIGTSVFQKINGEWLVTAFQNTYVQ
jgi:uncharacterized protein (TIGR02246 family)